MTDCNVGIPEDRHVVFRIGVNLGDIIVDGGDIYGDGVNIAARIARADQVLGEALERDLNRSMAHFAVGVLRRVQNRLSDSRVELETAVALDRNNARASQQLGLTLMWLGQPESAIPQIEKAIRLNPYDPNIASYYWALGSSDLVSGRIDDAASLLEKARAEYPWYGNAQFVALAEPTLYAGLRPASFPEE